MAEKRPMYPALKERPKKKARVDRDNSVPDRNSADLKLLTQEHIDATKCPLCSGGSCKAFFGELTKRSKTRRDYFECSTCKLIFMHPLQRLDAAAEKERYDTHNNDPSDPGYRKFLSKVTEPLLQRITPETHPKGLDFGCGPGPALTLLMEEKQFPKMTLFDPFYFPDTAYASDKFDYITSTEAFEHFYSPLTEWDKLIKILKFDGYLGIMTKRPPKDVTVLNSYKFSTWWYKNDPTHVCFFSEETFDWMCQHSTRISQDTKLSMEVIDEDTVLFKKTKI